MKIIILVITILVCYAVFLECSNRPIIGILSQDFDQFPSKYYPATNFIPASYVKAVEAAGARVAPIFMRRNFTYYKHLLRSINGVVIPGGHAPLQPGTPHYDAIITIYKLAKEMNEEQIFFPILGICRGFEALLVLSNDHIDMQISCNVLDENYPLIFAKNFRESLTFANLPEEIYNYLKYFDVTKNHHNWCTTRKNFTKYFLDKEWLITTTNVNRRGLEFVSSVEHRKYPFVGLQYHPEKIFEWKADQNNPHSRIAIRANRYFYDLIVDLGRQNRNAFHREKSERDALIYNYHPRMMEANSYFDQLYVFT